MVPAAPWPWVSSQTSRPDVAQAGVATWPVRAAAPGAAMAAAGTRAAVQANAPAMKNRRAAVVRKFMMYSFVQEGQPGDSRDYVSCSLEQSPDTSARYTALSRSVGCRGTAARARTGAAWQGVAPRSAGPNGPGYAACGGVLTTGQPAHQPGESDREWVESALPAVVVLAGVGLAGVLLIASSLKYPGIYRLPGAGAVVALSVAALLGYAACGTWALWHPAAGQRTGLAWGALGAAMWSAEIWAGGPAKFSYPAEQATGFTFVLLVL